MFRPLLTLLLMIALGGPVLLQAQETQRAQPPLKLGLGFCGNAYHGDLTPEGEGLFRFHPGMNVSFQFSNQKFISPQLNAGFSKFIAQDRDIPAVEGVQPNTFVETPFFYVDFRLRARFFRKTRINPWLSLGAGLLGYTPRDASGNSLLDNFATRNDGETYGSITAAFPFSIGTEIKLSPILALGLEATHRRVATDFIDNISALGPRKGKDRINSIVATLFITFDPEAMAASKIRGKDRR